MPLFEYLCTDCGRTFEKIVPRHDFPAGCIHCNSAHVEKQLSVFSVVGSSRETFTEAPGCGRCGADRPGICGTRD